MVLSFSQLNVMLILLVSCQVCVLLTFSKWTLNPEHTSTATKLREGGLASIGSLLDNYDKSLTQLKQLKTDSMQSFHQLWDGSLQSLNKLKAGGLGSISKLRDEYDKRLAQLSQVWGSSLATLNPLSYGLSMERLNEMRYSGILGLLQLRKLHDLPKDCTGKDPEICMNVTSLILSKGYPAEDHTVQTEDGFILSVQHIPHGRKQAPGARPVVFLQHGLLETSADWVINLPNQSLGFILADAGYDVWMGNFRGNTYSTKHVYLSPNQPEFWAWTWDQHARYDFPAQVEYVLEKTGATSLYYIGHSQGALVAFAELSSNQKLAKKIRRMFALAPITTLGNIAGPLKYVQPLNQALTQSVLYHIFGEYDFMPTPVILKFLAASFCDGLRKSPLCSDVMFLLCGTDMSHINTTRIPVYITHSPAGTSTRNILHFTQMIQWDRFAKYDFGTEEQNMKYYNQEKSPPYDLTQFRVPVTVYSGSKDFLASPSDIANMVPRIPSLVEHIQYPYNHMDFVWAHTAADTVYKHMLETMEHDQEAFSHLLERIARKVQN